MLVGKTAHPEMKVGKAGLKVGEAASVVGGHRPHRTGDPAAADCIFYFEKIPERMHCQ